MDMNVKGGVPYPFHKVGLRVQRGGGAAGLAGLNVEAGLAGAGTADHQHIFVDIVLGDFVSPHHDALCLRQENVLVELGIDERLNIVGISP